MSIWLIKISIFFFFKKRDKNDGLPISAKPDSDEEEDDHHDQALNANNNKPMAGTLEEFKKDIE